MPSRRCLDSRHCSLPALPLLGEEDPQGPQASPARPCRGYPRRGRFPQERGGSALRGWQQGRPGRARGRASLLSLLIFIIATLPCSQAGTKVHTRSCVCMTRRHTPCAQLGMRGRARPRTGLCLPAPARTSRFKFSSPSHYSSFFLVLPAGRGGAGV